MEIAFRGTAVSAENHGNFSFFSQKMRQRDAIGDAQHGAQVADHADYMVFVGTEVETALAAFGKTAFFTLPLGKEFGEGNAARSEHTQIPVQWQDVFVGVQCLCDSDRNGFLADAAEPFSHFALAQQYEHFLFNDPGFHQGTVQVQESFITQVSALKVHAAAKVSTGAERRGFSAISPMRLCL